MKSKQEFLEFTAEFGSVGSWAIWDAPGDTPRSNTEGMNWVTPDLWKKIKTDFVFIGLNLSSTHGNQKKEAWRNFHSSYCHQNDYKLRYALAGTKYWGSYLTDFIKHYKEVKSGEVIKELKKDTKIIKRNALLLEKELSYFPNKPVLVAMGTAVFKLLKNSLGSKYNIVKIKHYSCRIGKEKYREEVLKVLNS